MGRSTTGSAHHTPRQAEFARIYFDQHGQPVVGRKKITDINAVSLVELRRLPDAKVITITKKKIARLGASSLRAKTKKVGGMSAVILVTDYLTHADTKKLIAVLSVTGCVYIRPSRKNDWPTAPAKAERPTLDNRFNPTPRSSGAPRGEDGLPILDDTHEDQIRREMIEVFGEYDYDGESTDDAVVVTSSQVLQNLPDQCAQLLEVQTHHLTHDDLRHVSRVLKPSGRLKCVLRPT